MTTTFHVSRFTFLVLLLTAHCSLSQAGVPFRWSVETSRPPVPYELPILRGETADLSATLLSYGAALPLATNTAVVLYWQTNGMGSVWWPAAGTRSTNTLSATWLPSYDVGASAYTFFLAATNANDGRIYRAWGRIRMLGAPGDPAGGSPPTPTATWDARYDPAGAAASVSNALAAALQAETLASVTARGATTTNAVTIGSRAGATGTGSFVQGFNSTASGIYSHAQGHTAQALGDYSFASGFGAIASGESSHAWGYLVEASGQWSSAVGSDTTASGEISLAQGYQTVASGINSYALGFNALASHDGAYAWQGSADDFSRLAYSSHGAGTYNINPIGGAGGFWIGDETLGAIIASSNAEAIAAIPIPPTNAIVGWLVWDSGSNRYWRVSATNLRFYVWGDL